MKYIFVYIPLFIFNLSFSQNLVPNPSFENFTTCPSSNSQVGQIELAYPWTAATATSSSDYYNLCAGDGKNGLPGIPYSFGGFQNPRTGDAYAGFGFGVTSDTTAPNVREYLQVQLTSPLTQNKTYYVEFFVNLHNAQWVSPCNNIAANLSAGRPFTTNTYELQPLNPHIMLPGNPVISDTLNWVKISGCYMAQGGEEYLTIGNFFDNKHTQTTGTTTVTYYLVDDISVIETTSNCLAGVNEQQMYSYLYLSPNPSQGLSELHYQLFNNKDAECIITDMSGRLISSYRMPASQNKILINEGQLQSGIYFYSIRQGNVVLKQDKLVVYH